MDDCVAGHITGDIRLLREGGVIDGTCDIRRHKVALVIRRHR